VSYREEKLAQARAGMAGLAADPGVDAIYLAGSLLSGLGSPTSDIDVYAVTTAARQEDAVQIKSGKERLDVETFTSDWADGALGKVARWEISRTDLRSKGLTREELDTLIRMRDREVVKDSPALDRITCALDHSGDGLRRMTLALWALEANGHLSDCRGAYADGDLESAALTGQFLMICAGKAVAAAADDLYVGEKWVFRQLRRSAGDRFPHADFRRMQAGGWAADRDWIGFLTFFQTLMAASQLLGWRAAAVGQWPFWHSGEQGYWRHPLYNVVHLTQGVLLNYELRRQFVIKPDVALIWALCNGRTEAEIIPAAAALGELLDGGEPVSADRVTEVIAMLTTRRLISAEPYR
jgi:predicted nucleotidyltransferase